MTALTLSTFAPEVALLGATTIVGPSAAVSSTAVTGFSDVATATIVVKVERVDNSNGEALSVTVQGSDDGNSWATVAGPYSFTREGTQTLAVDSPADQLRVTYSAARGVREATIGSVTARVGVVDAPGGLKVAAVHVTTAELHAICNGTPKVLVAAPDSDTVLIWQDVVLSWRAGEVAYDLDPGLIVTWSDYQTTTTTDTNNTLNGLYDTVWVSGIPAPFSFTTDLTPVDTPQGQALVLSVRNPSAFSDVLGDGTCDMTVYYFAVPLT